MKRLRYLEAARRGIGDLADYAAALAGDDTRVGESVAAALDKQCRKLAALSGKMGRPRDELEVGLRSFPFRGYMIFFRYDGEELVVVDVLSARRDIDAYFGDE